MPTEIERKFLVKGDGWRSHGPGTLYCQGYIVAEPGKTVRVRIVGEQGFLTIKGPTQGIARAEFEYSIPGAEARDLLHTLCDRPWIEKTRYRIPHGEFVWEVDEFAGDNAGLIVAEVELQDDQQILDLPEWIGPEVSHDPRYFNANLAKLPYSQWSPR